MGRKRLEFKHLVEMSPIKPNAEESVYPDAQQGLLAGFYHRAIAL